MTSPLRALDLSCPMIQPRPKMSMPFFCEQYQLRNALYAYLPSICIIFCEWWLGKGFNGHRVLQHENECLFHLSTGTLQSPEPQGSKAMVLRSRTTVTARWNIPKRPFRAPYIWTRISTRPMRSFSAWGLSMSDGKHTWK
ncbi:hypothetical protein RSAG8_05619, partial [Rhizoctonia solani AG-8 WAC10335]